MSNDARRVACRRDEAHRGAFRRARGPARGELEVGRSREEAQPACLERKVLQEAMQLLAVAWQRVAQVHGRAVAEDDL
jgi:hypothetical protein